MIIKYRSVINLFNDGSVCCLIIKKIKKNGEIIVKYLEDKRSRNTLIVGIILVVVIFLFIRYDGFVLAMNKFFSVLRPVLIGGVIAFALKKPLEKIHQIYEKRYDVIYNNKLEKLKKKNNGVLPAVLPEKSNMPFRFAVMTVYLAVILFAALLVIIIVPQLIDSTSKFSENFDGYYVNVEKLIKKYYNDQNLPFAKWIQDLDIIKKIYGLSEYVPDILMKTFGVTAGFFRVLIDVILGIILSVYIISENDHLKIQGKKLGKRFLKKDKYDIAGKYLNLISDKFSSFIGGQLTEAIILGILCYIGMKIFGFDYAVLISTIIGLTNLVPIVGPIIGTVPGVFILLMADPSAALWFVIFIVILQQIESNLIYPKVVGGSMGLPALWVSVAVIVGGGLMGVLGMIIAIPLMSVVYTVLKEKVDEQPANQEETADD